MCPCTFFKWIKGTNTACSVLNIEAEIPDENLQVYGKGETEGETDRLKETDTSRQRQRTRHKDAEIKIVHLEPFFKDCNLKLILTYLKLVHAIFFLFISDWQFEWPLFSCRITSLLYMGSCVPTAKWNDVSVKQRPEWETETDKHRQRNRDRLPVHKLNVK